MNISIKDINGCKDSNHHTRLNSNSSNNSTANNSLNKSNNRTLSHSPKNKEIGSPAKSGCKVTNNNEK